MISGKVSAFLTLLIILSLASLVAGQMNRDTPFLGSKLPDTDSFSAGRVQAPASSLRISEPYNSQPSSDLMIAADAANTTCDSVSFQLTMTAAPAGSSGYQPVKVRILESRMGKPTSVADLTLLMPASGGSVHETIGFVSAAGVPGGNRSNEITVVLDPDGELSETDENNNVLTVAGSCPG
ncbi:MAG TPA: CARDB domain-containing protein [Methanothrix sp.]|jgi:hypothetical protein|nr:hypothetical protein [Methanothrix sp.]HPC89123.1 CARDB domain-containing protein [Methanothrix sp.]HQI67900.1 CARDB domain-containing protein [Methanothrix sp.]HRS84529.1 CARDB domain-containing protein [Methanothrix sp.]